MPEDTKKPETVTSEQLRERIDLLERRCARMEQALQQLAGGFGETQAETTANMLNG